MTVSDCVSLSPKEGEAEPAQLPSTSATNHKRVGVLPRSRSDPVGSKVRFYAIFADRIGSRVSTKFPKFVLKIYDQLRYGDADTFVCRQSRVA